MQADTEPGPVSSPPSPPGKPRQISLSAEQKAILEEPLDPRVDRILQGIYSDKAAAERAIKSRQIIEFPMTDLGERHLVQDENGFWRIVPVAGPNKQISLLDAL